MGNEESRAHQRMDSAQEVQERVSLEVRELDAVVESLTRLSEVRQQHPTLELLMNNVPFGVLLLDSELRFIGANKAYNDSFDANVEFRPGTPLNVILPQADEAGVTSLLRRALNRGRAIRVRNFRYEGFSKGITYWNGSAIPVRLTSRIGPHDAVAMVVLEVTDEILAREQLANFAVLAENRAAEVEIERARLKSVIEAVPVPLVVCDADARLVAFNSAAVRLFESSEMTGRIDYGDDIHGMFPTLLFNDDGLQIDNGQCPIARSLAGEECRNVVVHCWPSSPVARRSFSVSSAPLKDVCGRIDGAVAAISDITAQRRTQELIEEGYQREHAIATKLQQTFLASELPEIEGFEFEQAYRPAKDAAMVGGDFYDIFRLDEAKYAIVMADVAGKGLGSAVYTAMTKFILRAYALEDGTPQLALARLNEALSACTPSELFVTLFYGVIDTEAKSLTYANAGHENPLLLRAASGTSHLLEVSGPALALMKGSTYQTHTLGFDPGDVLVLYTDGITDAGWGLNRLGQDRLMELVRIHGTGSLPDLIAAVVSAAQGFAGGVLADDAALLAVRAL